MTEIKELDMNKYLVLKWEDINNILSNKKRTDLSLILTEIRFSRASEGKVEFPQYLVLNLNDEIDVLSIKHIGVALQLCGKSKVKVKDIAVDLVNAILKTKGQS